MRNRKEQRKLRRMGFKEEKLDFRDQCGIRDPTPYEAVKRIIAAERGIASGAHSRTGEKNGQAPHSVVFEYSVDN